MGRLADLKAKCSGGVSETCTQSEFAEFQNLSHESNAASWFDRVMGGVNSLSGTVFGAYDRATGQYHPPGQNYTPTYQEQPKKQTSPLVWILVVVGVVVAIVVMIVLLRKKKVNK